MNRRNYKSFEEILRDFINNSFNNSFEFKAPSTQSKDTGMSSARNV